MSEAVLTWSTVPERNTRSSVLLAVGDLLQREVDLDVLLREIVDRIVAAVDGDRGTVYLVDARRGDYRLFDSRSTAAGG